MAKGIKASTILRKAEKKLLNIKIFECHFTVNKLQDEKELLEMNLRTKLTETELEEDSGHRACTQNYFPGNS